MQEQQRWAHFQKIQLRPPVTFLNSYTPYVLQAHYRYALPHFFCMYVYIFICIYVSRQVCIYIYVCLSDCLSICMYMYIYIYISVYMSVSIYVRKFVYIAQIFVLVLLSNDFSIYCNIFSQRREQKLIRNRFLCDSKRYSLFFILKVTWESSIRRGESEKKTERGEKREESREKSVITRTYVE